MDAPAQAPFFVPFQRPDLIGREADVERLHNVLKAGRTAAVTPALTGQGGIGKTQLAVLYAHERAGAWPGGVFWLNAAREAGSPVPQLAAFAFKMNLPLHGLSGDAAEIDRRAALAWTGQIGSRRDTLLIADNLDDQALLTRDLPGLPGTRLPALGCTALITTRERGLPGCESIAVDLLGPDESRALLLREARRADGADDRAALDAIATLLGGLPLALRLAGGLLRPTPSVSLARFAEILRQRGAIRLLDQAGHPLPDYRDGMKVSLQALLRETWDALPAARPELKDILRVLGALPETLVARIALLRWLADCSSDPLGLRDPAECFEDTLAELRRRSLMEQPNPAHVRLHPLVHEYVKDQARDGFRGALIVRAAERLRSSDYLTQADADELLTLLRELPMLEAMADDAP